MATAAADAEQEPEDREVVGAQAGASQTVAQRLHGSLDRCPETSIEHGCQATREGGET